MLKNKEKTTEKIYSLAIETAVEAGSLALYRDGEPVDGLVGAGVVSRSADALSEIKKILEKNGAAANQIKSISVSSGPGSFTGIRIGAATAQGLCRALGCDLSARSVLKAMILRAFTEADENRFENENQNVYGCKILTAIPFGKSGICLQKFLIGGDRQIIHAHKPETPLREDFADSLKNADCERIIMHESLYRELSESRQSGDFDRVKILNAGYNLAFLIGGKQLQDANQKGNREQKISPIYVRNAELQK